MNEFTIYEAARAYAGAGYAVLPVKPLAKDPARMGGVNAATTDPGAIERWFASNPTNPTLNIGVAGGPVSGLLIVDVDPRNGGDKSLAAEERGTKP